MLKVDLGAALMPAEAVDTCDDVCGELEVLFNNVLATVVDYFEEVVVE